jgi:hypothetical protein
MLLLQTFGQDVFVHAAGDEVIVRGALAGEYGAAVVDERHYDRACEAFVLRLDVIDLSLKFYVCVESCDHWEFVGTEEEWETAVAAFRPSRKVTQPQPEGQ